MFLDKEQGLLPEQGLLLWNSCTVYAHVVFLWHLPMVGGDDYCNVVLGIAGGGIPQ